MRDLIIKEAKSLIGRDGLSFSLDTLAANLKISKKTIYKHMSNKEEIIQIIIQEAFKYTKSEQKKVIDSDTSLIEKIKGIMTIAPEEQDLFTSRNMHSLRVYYKKLYKEVDDLFNSDWEITYELIDEAKERGLLKPFNNQLFRQLYINGIFFEYESEVTYQERLDSIVTLLFEGVKK